MAAGPYGDLLGDAPPLPVVFIAAVPTILPSLTPPTLLLVTCGTMPPLPGGLTRTSPLAPAVLPGCYGAFLPWRLCALRWDAHSGPPSMLSPWPLTEPATQLRTLSTPPPGPRLSRHAPVAIRSSLPASHLRWAPVIIFSLHCFIATAGQRCPGNLELSLLLLHVALIWESC